jgi:GTP-binding protein Era
LLPDQESFLVEADLLSLEKEKDLVAEMILQSCFDLLFEEVPHFMAVLVREYNESHPSLVKIHADLVLAKESHKAMVIGKKGEMLKQIGSQARLKVEQLLGKKVFLGLYVVVKKEWEESPQLMGSLGYQVAKKKGKAHSSIKMAPL